LLGFDGHEDGHFIAVYEPEPVAAVVVPSSGDFVARGPVDRPVAGYTLVEDDCSVLALILVEGERVNLGNGGHVVADVDGGHSVSVVRYGLGSCSLSAITPSPRSNSAARPSL